MKTIYTCPNKCGDHRYPRPTWKTESGFNKHLAKCNMVIEQAKELKRQDELKQQAVQARLELLRKNGDGKHKIGDQIIFVKKVVTKPIYNDKGQKVRYEEEGYYKAMVSQIKDFVYQPDVFSYMTESGDYVGVAYKALQEADLVAQELTQKWKEANNFASLVR